MDRLLSETVFLWEHLQQTDRPVVLYGMGDGADKALKLCEEYGVPVSGVFASDGFVRGHTFHGFEVLTLRQMEERFDDFIVLLCFASQRPEVLALIEETARRHTLFAPDMPVYGTGILTPAHYRAHADDIRKAWELMADEQSRLVFEHLLRYKLSGRIDFLRACETPRQELWDNLIQPGDREFYVDAGAYSGDTVEEFIQQTGGRFQSIVAVEPDGRNFRRLTTSVARLGLQNIHCFNQGVWSGRETLRFAQKSGRQASLSETGTPIAVDSLDNVVHDIGSPTIIKYDVEGVEEQALAGTRRIMERDRPTLIVSAYHRTEDFVSLPLLIHSLQPDYRLYLRHHPSLPAWDTNLIARC